MIINYYSVYFSNDAALFWGSIFLHELVVEVNFRRHRSHTVQLIQSVTQDLKLGSKSVHVQCL